MNHSEYPEDAFKSLKQQDEKSVAITSKNRDEQYS